MIEEIKVTQEKYNQYTERLKYLETEARAASLAR